MLTWGTYHHLTRLLPADAEKIFGAFISAGLTVTTTLLGFLLATYSIFQALNTRRKQFLIQLGYLGRVNGYLRNAIWLLLIAVLVLLGLVLFPVSFMPVESWQIIEVISVGITAYSLTSTVRFVYIFLRLVVDDAE